MCEINAEQMQGNLSKNRQLTEEQKSTGTDVRSSVRGKAKAQVFDPITARPPHVSVTAWAGYSENRKSLRRPLTERACELIAAKLRAHPATDDVLNLSIENG